MMNGMKYNSQTKWPEDHNDLGWKKPNEIFGVEQRTEAQRQLQKTVAEMRQQLQLLGLIRKVTDGWVRTYGLIDVQSMSPPKGLIFSMMPKYKDS